MTRGHIRITDRLTRNDVLTLPWPVLHRRQLQQRLQVQAAGRAHHDLYHEKGCECLWST